MGVFQDKIFHPHQTEDDHILLFFKLYNPVKEDVRYVGKLFVKGNNMPRDIRKELNEMANFSPSVELMLYKETGFACHHLEDSSFEENMLDNGDIIWFQKACTEEEYCPYPDVPSFVRKIHYSLYKVICTAREEVSNKKVELKKLEATVIQIKDKLKELEADVVALEANSTSSRSLDGVDQEVPMEVVA
ncbi:hypothetical protein C5167_041627 [Papaver somniferum]|nr:hypothetical protein C5167_041627 [Papaver somniferum]